MKKKLHSFLGTGVCLGLLLTFYQPAFSQSLTFGNPGIEVGLNIGPMNFLGDVGGNYGKGRRFLKDNNFEFFRLMKGAYVTASLAPAISARFAINFGRLEGHDSAINGKGGMEEARRVRDLGFRSNLFEAYVAAEIYPTVFFESDPTDVWHKIRPYGILGIGMFKFNPQAQYIDPSGRKTWVDLQPLRTEGQGMAEYPDRKAYKLTEIAIPFGAGVKYYVTEKFHVGLEVMHRFTFTDYIDDVSTNYIDEKLFAKYLPAKQVPIALQMSDRQTNGYTALSRPDVQRVAGEQRGNPKQNDSYFSFGLKLGWRINSGGNKASLRQSRCPVW